MKRKLLVFGILALLLGLSASVAVACNCGKKVDGGNQGSSCQTQCAGGCGGQSACSDGSFQLAQATVQQEGQEEKSKAVEVGNKICPVSGDKIPAPGEKSDMGEVIKYEYKGKIYNLCCEMCVKDFKKDPEKYSKIAEEEAKKSQEQGESTEHKEGDGHEHHNHGK